MPELTASGAPRLTAPLMIGGTLLTGAPEVIGPTAAAVAVTDP